MRELASTEGLTRFGVAGYSLGGNLALKLAGETGADPAIAPWLLGVCAVSPTMDLARCVDALERRANAVYQWNFVRNLKARMRRKAAAWPGRYDTRAAVAACAPYAASTTPTRRRTTASPAPPTTTIAPARCASSSASACRR